MLQAIPRSHRLLSVVLLSLLVGAAAGRAPAAPAVTEPVWLRSQCSADIAELCRNAATNNAESQLKLAEYYRDHNDLTALDGKAIDSERYYGFWIEKAAKNGSVEAQYLLGERNRIGGNYSEAVRWLYEAANHPTSPNANARYQLGVMFFNGQGVKQDLSEARNLMLAAAESGSCGGAGISVVPQGSAGRYQGGVWRPCQTRRADSRGQCRAASQGRAVEFGHWFADGETRLRR